MAQVIRQYLPVIQIVTAVIIWAASFIAMKIAVAELGPFLTVFLRMLLAVAVLLFFIPTMRRAKQQYQQGDWLLLVGLVLCEPCLYFVFEGLALTYTSASEAGMITALHPFMVTIAAWYFLKEQINQRMLSGGLVAVVGAVLLSISGSGSSTDGNNHLLGNFLEFIAIAFATGYTLLARKLSGRYSPVFLTAIQAAFGTVFFLPLTLSFEQGIPVDVSSEVVYSILFLAWGVNVIAFILYNASFKAMPASQVGLWLNLLPLSTLLFGWLVLDESLNTTQYFAAGLVLAGLIYSQIKPRRKSVFIEQSLIKREYIDQLVGEQEKFTEGLQSDNLAEDSLNKAGLTTDKPLQETC
ncbi:DMT family transporter [Aliikangiella sp. G2MR2-5]|uniref:DMT family transporter n=1 Tax=Aliikangiella sp. G2MR2-5 TaxID=2788943 RepID=UPI0018AC344B|nr:DMT family transporter [Aliikangiella sp. G2MR2-5]